MRRLIAIAWMACLVGAGSALAQAPERSPVMMEQRVVLDPGHGANDAGVEGPGGLSEGQLTMALARQVSKALKRELGYQVYLTREANEDPGLAERTSVANRLKAVLFLSLHIGGAPGGSRAGFRVYYQDYSRQAGLAARALIRETDPFGANEWILAQAAHLDRSRRLARELDQAMQEVLRIKSPGPLGAPLAVLTGADMPAVLMEVGCLDRPEEARRLGSQGYRDALTRAIVRGVAAWRQWRERRLPE